MRTVVSIYERCGRWVHADQHHNCTVSGRMAMSERSTWNLDAYSLYLQPGSSGPYAARPALGHHWADLA